MRSIRPPSGWALVVVLIALAIVAFLGRDALSAWIGRVPSAPGTRVSAAAPAMQGPATVGPSAPLERARAVEPAVLKQADERRRDIDDGTR